ncbi:metal ABC transporter solute-binding protein, Zn/Mn family [Porphyromonas sp. COT-239 OH1446]|uniref:metal ABC transporter solute-binding protein, Zn/Mn family n=1 Tax=Porphyromonas sp. COT-239 OH1446 TaxID=1515613 RepID=UPI00052C3CC7|nr:zinc ABC transporter substrate-binding protein [Porphyromonas sp. COT-239 OH1446]KGN71234.1 hypothetical protein HQ37_01925 [Porphyromonas sp. COT-239 OH1446]
MSIQSILSRSKRGSLPLLLILLLTLGCTSRGQSEYNGRLRIATTISPTASIIRSLTDTLAEVTVLLPQGNPPETYEPTPLDVQTLSQSHAYLYVGDLGFERNWLRMIRQLHPNLQLVDLSVGLEEVRHQCSAGHDHEHSDHDPHYWTGIRGIRHMSRQAYEAICRLDTAHRAYFSERYNYLSKEIDALEQEVRESLTKLSTRSFVIYHPSLTDFAEEFGLEQLVIEQEGKDPNPQQLRRLIARARETGVQVVFIQQEFSPHLTRSIASELGAREVVINPLSEDWRSELRAIVRALTQG